MDTPSAQGLCIDLGPEPSLRQPARPRLALPPRDALLLARLLIDGPQPRATLAAWLWPQATQAGALANLRQRLKRLQDASSGALLDRETSQVALAVGVGQHLWPAPDFNDPAVLDAPLLPGLDALRAEVVDAPAKTWLKAARERLLQARSQACTRRALSLEATQAVDEALPLARWLVAHDGDDAAALRLLMRLHHARGETALALRAFRVYQQRLRRQLDTAPDAATRALADTLALVTTPGRPRAKAAAAASASVPHEAAPAGAWLPADLPHWALLGRPPRRVQREAAWAQLQGLARHGGLAWLLGPGGVGKTRLAHDFCETQASALRLACRPGLQAVPYALLSAWVHGRQAQAQALPPAARAELARLAPALGPPAPGPLQVPLLLQAIRALQLQPPRHGALCIDDLHLADAASLALLPALLADEPCVLLCLRPEGAPAALRAWLDSSDDTRPVERVELGALSVEGVAGLLADVGLPGMAPDDWAPLLWRHTGGHPFLLLETLRALARAPRPPGGRPPAQLPSPPRVRELLQQRVQALSPLARQLAELAALAGEHFSARLATLALGGVAQQAGLAWAELQASGYLGPAVFGQARLHDLVADALRSAMTPPVAAQRHRQVAAALQTMGPVPPARLAHHWAEAGQPRRAARLHQRAADQAARLSSADEQVAELDRAATQWALTGDAARAFEARLQATEARITYQQLQQGLDGAQALQQQARGLAQQAASQRVLAIAHGYRSEHAAALHWGALAYASAQALGRADWQVDAAALAALGAAFQGQHALAAEWLAREQAVPADQAGWRSDLNRLSARSNTLVALGRAEQALQALEQALVLARRPEAQHERGAMLGNAAAIAARLGLADEVLRHATQALTLAQPLALHDGGMTWLNAALHQALGQVMTGELDAARQGLEAARDRADAPALASFRIVLDHHLAWVWTQLGQPARALRILTGSEPGLKPAHHMRRWSLLADLRRLCDASLALPPAPPSSPADSSVAALFEMARVAAQPAAERAPALGAVHRQLQAQGTLGAATWAAVLALEAQAELASDLAAAQALAPEAQALWQQVQQRCCLGAYRPELLQRLAAVLQQVAGPAAAQPVQAAALAWVQQAEQRLRGTVWHESFVHRNRVNAALLRGR